MLELSYKEKQSTFGRVFFIDKKYNLVRFAINTVSIDYFYNICKTLKHQQHSY